MDVVVSLYPLIQVLQVAKLVQRAESLRIFLMNFPTRQLLE